MNQPKIFSEKGWSQAWVELAMLYALTMVAVVIMLDMHWLVAMSVTPFVMLAMLLAVLAFVQLLWMLVVGLDKIGTAAGVRKSPLS